MSQRDSSSPSRYDRDSHYDTPFLKPSSKAHAILPPPISHKKPPPVAIDKGIRRATPTEVAEFAHSQQGRPLASRLYSQVRSPSPILLDASDSPLHTDSPLSNKLSQSLPHGPWRGLDSPLNRSTTPLGDMNSSLVGRRSSTPTSYNTIAPSTNRKAWAETFHTTDRKPETPKDSKVFMHSSFLEKPRLPSPSPNSSMNQTLAPLLHTKSSSLENLREDRFADSHKKPKLAPVDVDRDFDSKNTSNQRSKNTSKATDASKSSKKKGKGVNISADEPTIEQVNRIAARARQQALLEEADRKAEKELAELFEKFRSDSGTSEFFYLTPTRDRHTDVLYNPYRLRMARHEELNQGDYYTLSTSGITHFVNGIADFTSLDQFDREKKIYDKMMRIRLFSRFRIWKSYSVWKKNVKSKKMNSCCNHLEKNLFILNDNMRNSLLELQVQLERLQSIRLYRLKPKDMHTLLDFFRFQEKQKSKTCQFLEDFMDTVRGIVFAACDKALTKAGQTVEPPIRAESPDFMDATTNTQINNTTTSDHLRTLSTPKRINSPLPKSRLSNALKASQEAGSFFLTTASRGNTTFGNDFFLGDETEQKMSYTELAAKRAECRRLTNFIKVIDYHIIHALHDVVLKSVHDVCLLISPTMNIPLERVKVHMTSSRVVGVDGNIVVDKEDSPSDLLGSAVPTSLGYGEKLPSEVEDIIHRDKRAPIYLVELVLLRDEISILPTLVDYFDMIEAVAHQFIGIAVSVDKLLTHEEFKVFTQPSFNDHLDSHEVFEGPNISSIINDDSRYQRFMEEIKAGIHRSFSSVEKYMTSFGVFREMYMENKKVDFAKMRAEDKPLEFYRTALEEYQVQKDRMDGMPVSNQIAIFYVDSTKLKNSLIPSPVRCIRELHSLIPIIGRVKNEDLLVDLNSALSKLSEHPHSVEKFVDYLAFLQDVGDQLPSLRARYELVNRIYYLLEEHRIYIPPEEYAIYQTLGPTFGSLKNALAYAESTKATNINRFVSDLNVSIGDLKNTIIQIRDDLMNPMIFLPDSNMEEVINMLNGLTEKAQFVTTESERFQKYQNIFRVEPTRFDEFEIVQYDLNLKRTLWVSLKNWQTITREWVDSPLETIDADTITTAIQTYTKNLLQLERGLPENIVVLRLRQLIEEFRVLVPIVSSLRNPALKPRHWERIQEAMQQRLPRDSTLTLRLLYELNVLDFKDAIGQISTEASQEAALEDMLKKVESTWQATEFTISNHREMKDSYIITNFEDINILLEDSHVTISTISASRYVTPIKNIVDDWERQLTLFSETLEEWILCQKNWLYLESIFGASDIQRQLPNEAKMFSQVDKSWKDLMRRTKDYPNALRSAIAPGVLESLQNGNHMLARIQKGLEEYLETKRLAFPRFYFLSNDELLEILAQSRSPEAVQPHLLKLFDNIAVLEFVFTDPKSPDVLSMKSSEGEVVTLAKPVKARGNVESWLTSVENSMMLSIKRLMKQGVIEYESTAREDWVLSHAAQIVLTVSQIFWCREVVSCLSSTNPNLGLTNMLEGSVAKLAKLAELVRGDLTSLQRGILGALLTIDVHARDILTALLQERVSSVTDFSWIKQLRYYYDADVEDTTIRQTSASFGYGNEYLGCTTRLVLTPLTDRCYITLTTALSLQLGGAPSGPAGTGKTETVKDLAKALAKQCVVFNCSDGLDYKMMGKFFSGLVQAGAWCCFDEFNRIDIEVLSVIAQQILTIKYAMSARMSKFMFEGHEIKLNPTCGYFITMNPGYAGRTELPDNLQALFRPVAMMIPDYALIAEIVMFSEGFEGARVYASKMVNLYKLSSEQLSQQDHYDFGLRAVKSVLVMAGSLKRSNPTLPEDVVLIRALRDSNLPKFLAEDVPLFQGIMSDLFPGVHVPDHEYGSLSVAIKQSLATAKYQHVPDLEVKILQLYETMNVRHGVMLVGPTASGKTVCYQTLSQAMNSLHKTEPSYLPVKTYVINPKCISMGELYGEYNLTTREWHDGLAASIVRHSANDSALIRKWVIFDGPVDAMWIENMNSVLDDNKLLCLANGERIKLSAMVHMMFEVGDLANASPATVSRCGMVYMQPKVIGYMPYVRSWADTLHDLTSTQKEHVVSLFDHYIADGLAFVRKECKENIPSVDFNLVSSLCNLMQGMMADPNFDPSIPEWDRLLDGVFVFSYMWSLGGNVTFESQDKFESFARSHLEHIALIPGARSAYEYFFDPYERVFKLWEMRVPSFYFSLGTPFFKILVPTKDTIRFAFFLDTLITVRKPVLFIGQSGVGKTVIINDTITKMIGKGSFVGTSLNFSAQTSSSRTQDIVESKFERKRKNVLGGPAGKGVIVFVDDVNMPKADQYGTQPPIELLRQLIDFKGFYDRQKLVWKEIHDATLVAACAPPGGGRHALSTRFIRHFNMLNIPTPSQESMKTIFSQIMDNWIQLFNPEYKYLSEAIVESSIALFTRICNDLRPTPAKSHYTFNLRDLAKVFQGVMQIKSITVTEKGTLIRLWIHETSRIFCDRLTTEEDRRYFREQISDLLLKYFDMRMDPERMAASDPILFGDYFMRGVTGDARMYTEVPSMMKTVKLFEEYQEDYNVNSQKEMHLVFFRDAVEHLSRICRIIRQPRGNALLVGVSGVGKQSLTRLACNISEYKCYQIQLTKSYNATEFREDLKKLYFTAGIEGHPIVFLLSDTQIVNEGFLEDVNNILNSGEVPNLFETDEYEKILNDMRPHVKLMGLSETRENLWKHFIHRVQDNLHIVLCMSPVGDSFRNRCRMFPSLVNCCTIDWFEVWPLDALQSVSKQLLEKVPLMIEATNIMDNVCSMCVEVHSNVVAASDEFYQALRRRYYTTPTSYLEFVGLFISMLEDRRKEILSSRERLNSGLTKLLETNEMVAVMQVELSQLQPVLEKKARAIEALLEQLSKDQQNADAIKKVVLAEESVVKQQTQETQALAEEAQRDLDEAMPILNAAVEALNSLNKNDISEIKSFTKPPELVLTVMESVCTLLQAKTDWPSAKGLLNDPGFLNKLIGFDKDHIPEAVLKKVKKYIDNPQFVPATVAKVSVAAKSICMWVRAIEHYSKVAKAVEPKKLRMLDAQLQLEASQQKLTQKQMQLSSIEGKLGELRKKYEDSLADKTKFTEKMDETSKRLARASKLTNGLSSEQLRWSETITQLDDQMKHVIGDSLLSAACVAYLGAFTGYYRDTLVRRWVYRCQSFTIPVSPNFSLVSSMSDPLVLRDWALWGLPRDNLSIENGILVTKSRRWPLVVDPQSQASRWIKNMESKNGLKVIHMSDSSYMRTLENCIRNGIPVLLEDVGEKLDPALDPVLAKQTFKQGGRVLMKLGEVEIDYDKNFRFYITTKLHNPHYLPETFIRVTVINFTVTPEGLEDQLLGEVVRKERPDLEEKSTAISVNTANDKKQLRSLEDKILKLLQQSEGNILDDEVLIDTLGDSKNTAQIISERLKDVENTEAMLEEARERYRPVAMRGSILFFVMSDFVQIDPMYQYSLQYFLKIFNGVIETSPKSGNLNERLQILVTSITSAIFENVARGLFEDHKLIFAFMITCKILMQRVQVSESEFSYFLRGSANVKEDIPADCPPWMPETTWANLCALANATIALDMLLDEVKQNSEAWKAYASSKDIYNEPLPNGLDDRVLPFHKLMMIKVLRPENLVPSMVNFVADHLGKVFVETRPFDLEKAFDETSKTISLIFILSPGADPINYISKLVRGRGYADRLLMISLGQGQGPLAQNYITRACKTGDWVYLQNCHLAASWMPSLEKIVLNISAFEQDVHPDFRLFLSSMPTKDFPTSILQNGVKVTNEPPKGLRANLLRSYADITERDFEECYQSRAWQKLLFGLCFFMAVIQERKKFGSLGWNIKYQFNQSDLEISRSILKSSLNENDTIPWKALQYLIGEINYGGRVTDDWDRRCLTVILRQFLVPDVLGKDHQFSASGEYHPLAIGASLSDYRHYIETLPLQDNPEVFCMHQNANLAAERFEATRIIETILSTQPRKQLTGGPTSQSPDEMVLSLTGDILSSMPNPLRPEDACPMVLQPLSNGRPNSLTTVLMQEISRFNRLVQLIKLSLRDLQFAVKGLVVMSAELEKVYDCLLRNAVPTLWSNAAYPSLKPLASWVTDLKKRITVLQEWLIKGQPASFWVSGLYFPQGFLTATLQNYARKYQIPVDQLSFSFQVTNKFNPKELKTPEDGVYVHGLFLEGARWDTSKGELVDATLGELFSPMPAIHFQPKENYNPDPRDYKCPVYKTTARAGTLSTTGHSTNFVVAVNLVTSQQTDLWVKRAAALVCQLDD